MSNYSKMYWLTRLDGINTLLGLAGTVCLFIAIFIYITTIEDGFENEPARLKKWQQRVKGLIVSGLFLIILFTFIPTKNEAIIIIAGGKTLDYVQKDTSLNKIPYQTTTVISNYLYKIIKEMKENK